MAPSTSTPPAIVSTRGENIDTSCDDSREADAHREHERDEADAGPKRAVAEDVLHVQPDAAPST